MSNLKIIDNFGGSDAVFIGKTNSIVKVKDSLFEGNFNLGRGGVALADAIGSQFYFEDSIF